MPFNFAPTEVMTLGSVRRMRVGDFYTQPPAQFMNPRRTTPSFPQNLVRQTLNGLGRVRHVALGDLPTDVPPALTNQSADPTAASVIPGTGQTDPISSTLTRHVRAPWVELSPATTVVVGSIATASSLVSLYHGYRRNNSLGWGLLWGFMGAMFPLVTPTVALAQGFAVRRGRA